MALLVGIDGRRGPAVGRGSGRILMSVGWPASRSRCGSPAAPRPGGPACNPRAGGASSAWISGTSTIMAPDTVRLLEVDPDLARFLAYEDQVEAERLTVRTVTIERGQHSVEALLGRAALGATVLEGMVLQRLQLANHLTMKIFGPGDLLARADGHRSMLIGKNSVSAVEGTRLALLGN